MGTLAVVTPSNLGADLDVGSQVPGKINVSAAIKATPGSLTRALIATTAIPVAVTRFRTKDTDAPYIRGTSTGPYAIQDALAAWWNIDVSLGFVQAEWFGADPTGAADSAPSIQAAANALMATATNGVKLLRFGPGRFLFNSCINVTVPTSFHNGVLYNGIEIRGAGQYATKFIAGAANATGLWSIAYTYASSIVRMRRFSMISTLDATSSANQGVNNGVAVHVYKTDGTPTNPLSSLLSFEQAWFEDINVCGDADDEGVAVLHQGLWAKVFQVDYTWLPTFRCVNVVTPGGGSPSNIASNYPGLNAASVAAGSCNTSIELNGCYDPQFLECVKLNGWFQIGVHYHGTLTTPGQSGRMEGGAMSLPEIGGALDCVVVDQSYDFTITATASTSSATLTGMTNASSGTLYPGYAVTGPGIPSKTTIVSSTSNSVTLSKMPTVAGAGTFTIKVEPNIFSDDLRITAGQLSPRRHGIVLDRYQEVDVSGIYFIMPTTQWDASEPLPAAIYCKTASDIKLNDIVFCAGYASNLTPGSFNGAVAVRIEGASTCIDINQPFFNHGGISVYVDTIPSTNPYGGLQRSIQLRHPRWGGRTDNSNGSNLPVYDPQGLIIQTSLSQDANIDYSDVVSRTGNAYNSPTQRIRRLRPDFATSSNSQLGKLAFTGLDSNGAEVEFISFNAVSSSNTAGACKGVLNMYAMVNGVGTLLMAIDGYASSIDIPKLICSAGASFFGASPVTTKPTVSGTKGSNAALASLISALASYGLITDSTTT